MPRDGLSVTVDPDSYRCFFSVTHERDRGESISPRGPSGRAARRNQGGMKKWQRTTFKKEVQLQRNLLQKTDHIPTAGIVMAFSTCSPSTIRAARRSLGFISG